MPSFDAIPNEIWADIFLDSRPETVKPEEGPTNTWKLDPAPWNLGHICRHWRDIVKTTPGLWTNISVSITWKHLKDTPLEALREQLARAGSTIGLAFSVFVTDLPPADTKQYHLDRRELLNLVVANSHRCTSASWHDLTDEFFRLLGSENPSFPLLKRVGISRCNHTNDLTWRNIFRDSIQLQAITIDLDSLMWLPPQCLPREQFKSFMVFHQLDEPDRPSVDFQRAVNDPDLYDNFFEHYFADSLPNVKEMHLLKFFSGFRRTHSATVTSIRSLTVQEHRGGRPFSLSVMPFLTLPNLRSLRLGGEHNHRYIKQLVDRSSCSETLRRLSFDVEKTGRVALTPLDLEDALEAVPRLESLSFGAVPLTGPMVWVFLKKDRNGGLKYVPLLRSLRGCVSGLLEGTSEVSVYLKRLKERRVGLELRLEEIERPWARKKL